MAQTYIPGWLYGVLRMAAQGNVFENTFSLATTPGLHPSGSDLAALAADWWTVNGPSLQACMSQQIVYQTVTIRDLNDATGAEGVYTMPVNTHGNLTADPVPYNAAAVISWRSATVGRRGRGRWYAVGIPEDQCSGNVMSATIQTLFLAAGVVLNSYVGTGSIPVNAVVASRVGHVLYDITQVVVDAFIDSQRRRLQGRGI
jgi:hypothetical protein